jgi:hypothetical protein
MVVNDKRLQNQLAKFNETWYKLSLGDGNSSFLISLKGPGPLERGDNQKCYNEVRSFKKLLQNH